MKKALCNRHKPRHAGEWTACVPFRAKPSHGPGRRIIDALLSLILTLPAMALGADEWQPHESILDAVRSTILQAVPGTDERAVVDAGPIDSRVRLALCGEKPEVRLPADLNRRNRMTAEVRCRSPVPWKIHVPAQLTIHGPVVVAARRIARGSLLEADDLEVVDRPLGQLAFGYLTAVDSVSGQQLKRAVSTGQVITPAMLDVLPVVRRGQRVSLTADSGPIKVRMVGVALSDGAMGQRIRVRNTSSNREIEGVVRSPQVVEILLR